MESPAETVARLDAAAVRQRTRRGGGSMVWRRWGAGVVPLAREAGARVVIVNAEPTDMDQLAAAVLRGPIGAPLPAIAGGE